MIRNRTSLAVTAPLVTRAILFVVALAGFAMSISSPVCAALYVYHSPDQSGSVQTDPIEVLEDQIQDLHLFIASTGSGTSTGVVCEDGDGAELCGYDVAIESVGGGQFVSFLPAAGVVYSLTSDRLRVNAVEAVIGITSPASIGTLTVDTTGGLGGRIDLFPSEVLDASLAEISMPQQPVVLVPEPGTGFSLLGGMGLLAAFERVRRASR